MRYMNIIVGSKVREAVQAIVGNSDEFSTSCNRTRFQIWCNDVKDSRFVDFRMSYDRTSKKRSIFEGRRNKIALLGAKNISDMVSLDPRTVTTSSKPGERNDHVIRKGHYISMSIYESSFLTFVVYIHDRHHQRRLHVHGSMKSENSSKTFLNNVIQSSVFGHVGFEIINEASAWPWRLAEK